MSFTHHYRPADGDQPVVSEPENNVNSFPYM